jgi:hypothetical protein
MKTAPQTIINATIPINPITEEVNGNNGNVIANISSFFAKPSLVPVSTSKKGTSQQRKREPTGETATKKSQQTYNKKTLDEQHTEKINYFKQINEEKIPQLMEMKTQGKRGVMDGEDLNKRIRELRNEEKNYLLKNSKYIFQYFEEKKNISGNSGANNGIHSFFTLPQQKFETVERVSTPYVSNKKKYENYWKNVNNEILSIQDYIYPIDVCTCCKNGELISQEEEGVLICNKCGVMVPHIIESSKPSNKEPPNEVSYTAYIRLNHFKEILSQFQAKETTQIPVEVIDAIRARIKKERIEDVTKIDYHKMREILRKLGLNKYFEHIQYINSLFGIKPPIMNEELHETLCMLFIEIQQPWAIHNPPHRRNFFNYTYTLYQLCVLLDQTQYLPYIPMMKDRDKQLEQDMIWKKVCGELGWKFFATL